jgi:hypothetical protein
MFTEINEFLPEASHPRAMPFLTKFSSPAQGRDGKQKSLLNQECRESRNRFAIVILA